MSAVMYVCPKPGCGRKGFDEPGGTKMVCHVHQERMVQHEAGPDVFVAGSVNEQGQGNIGNDFRFRQAKQTRNGDWKPDSNPAPVNEPGAVERTRLNDRYRELTGQPASRAWSMDQLRLNVKFAEDQAAGNLPEPPQSNRPVKAKKETPA